MQLHNHKYRNHIRDTILYIKKEYINKYFLPFPVGLQFVAEN